MNKKNSLQKPLVLLLSVGCWSLSATVHSASLGAQAVDKLVSQMTLEEKIDLIGGYKNFYIRGIERLGIPEIRIADGPVGIRNFGPSTAYPASISLAATWDKSLAFNTGKALGLEARNKNIHLLLGPGVNIYRFP